MSPVRIQRKRSKGWKMPPNTIYVGRGSAFGNLSACTLPHFCKMRPCGCCPDEKTYCCIEMYEEFVSSGLEGRGARIGTVNIGLDAMSGYPYRSRLVERLPTLRGKNLACWCDLERPCHADILLELANRPPLCG